MTVHDESPSEGHVPAASSHVVLRHLIVAVIAAVGVGTSVPLNRYTFPDTSQLSYLDGLTGYADAPLAELDLVDRYVRYGASGEKYRPIANVGYVLKYYGIRRWTPYAGVLVNFVSMLLAGVALYGIANRIGSRPWFNLLVPFLYLLAPVVIAQSWLHVVTEDALVVALSAASILAYVEWRRTNVTWLLCAAALLAFLGPYYKEPTISSSIALFVAELFSGRRNRWPLVLLGAVALNSMYPSVLANLVVFGEWIPARFSTSFVHRERHYTAVSQHLAMQVPPTLLLLGLCGVAITFGSRLRRRLIGDAESLGESGEPDRVLACADWFVDRLAWLLPGDRSRSAGVVAAVVTLLLLGSVVCLFHAPVDVEATFPTAPTAQPEPNWFPKQLPSDVFFVLLAVAGFLTYLRGNAAVRVTVLWFGATYVGMARYFFIDHHLMYVLPGFSLLVVHWLQRTTDLVASVARSRRTTAVLTVAGWMVGVVAVCDPLLQLLNTAALHRSVHAAEDAVLAALPADRSSILLANSVLAHDVASLSEDANGRTPVLTSLSGGCRRGAAPSPSKASVRAEFAVAYGHAHIAIADRPAVMTLEQLRRLWNGARAGGIDVHLLHNERSFWRFWPVDPDTRVSEAITTERVAHVRFETNLWFADPLRHATSVFFAPRPVPPDFHRETVVRRKGPFRDVVEWSLDLRRVTNVADTFPEPAVDGRLFGSSQLVNSDYFGFSIFQLDGGFVAVPGPVEALDPALVFWRVWDPCYVGDTLSEVRRMVRCVVQSRGATVTAAHSTDDAVQAAPLLTSTRAVWSSPLPDKGPAEIVVSFPEPRAADEIRIMSEVGIVEVRDGEYAPRMQLAPRGDVRAPGRFTLLASSDGTRWTELLSVDASNVPDGPGGWRSWTFENNVPYRVYKLRIHANRGGAERLSLQSLQLLWP